MLGGGQQNGMRSGTDNVPGIAGLGVAARESYQDLEEKNEHLYRAEGAHCGRTFRNGKYTDQRNASERRGSSYIEHQCYGGQKRGPASCSGGSEHIHFRRKRCSSHKRKPSAALTAMGMPKDQIESTVRLSFSEENTVEEADYFLQTMKEIVPMLRRYSRDKEKRRKIMLFHAFLIKYAEIAIKGKNRYLFEDALVKQMRLALEAVEEISRW